MNYAAARLVIDPDADYVVHVRTDTGWTAPADPGHRQLPGLDVLVAARRVLRAEPPGTAWCTSAEALHLRSGDGRLWLRFVLTAVAETDLCPRPGCAEILPDSGNCACAGQPAPDDRAPAGLWRVLGLADSAMVPLTSSDLTRTDLVVLARACHLLAQQHHAEAAHTPLPATARPLLERLALVLDDLDEGRPHAVDVDAAFRRDELLTLADAALALYRAHGDVEDVLGRPSVLLLAHLAYTSGPN